MRRTLTWSVLVALGLGLLSSAQAAERTVIVDSFFFEDSTAGDGRVVVDRGDTISFRFEGTNEHSATVEGLFDSGVKGGGTVFTTSALTKAGTFTLFCTEHGAETHGTTLVVRGPAGASPAPTARPTTAKPTPAPSRAAATPKPAPARTTAAPATVIPAPSTAAAAPRASTPARATAPVASPTPDSALSPAPTAATDPVDDGRDWLIPALVVLLLLLSAGAFALSRRDPTRRAP